MKVELIHIIVRFYPLIKSPDQSQSAFINHSGFENIPNGIARQGYKSLPFQGRIMSSQEQPCP